MRTVTVRRLSFVVLLLGLAMVGLWYWRGGQDPAPQQVAATPPDAPAAGAAVPAASPQPAAAASAVASPSTPAHAAPFPPLLSLTSVPARADERAPAIADRWPAAITLATAERPVDGTAWRQRVRIIRADFKYPLLRLEELLRPAVPAPGATTAGAATPPEAWELVQQVAMVADHVVARPAPGVDEAVFAAAIAAEGGAIRTQLRSSGAYLVAIPGAGLDSLPVAIDRLGRTGAARYAEPDFVVHTLELPDDPALSQLWGLHNTGQTGGVPDADIDAPEAWEITTGSRAVTVGVIDTGIDLTHPDLAANAWVNPGEIAGNQLDDDGNGYIDDVRGWDFVHHDNLAADDHGHGTHCAGTIGAVGDNTVGVAGVAWQVSLVPLKFLNAGGAGATSDAVEAITYATGLGLDLTSNSWGGGGHSQALLDAITAAGAAGQLFVAAAGNSARDTDASANYPSSYPGDHLIAVAATDHHDALAYFSNYGASSVDLAAPGVGILSTTPGASYASFSGTSMATPHVAGALALLRAAAPDSDPADLVNALFGSVDPVPALAARTLTGGRLNVHAALQALDDLSVSPAAGWQGALTRGAPVPSQPITYTLRNRGTAPLTWDVTTPSWLSATPTTGTLAAGASLAVTVDLSPASAGVLTLGSYTGTIRVGNLTSGRAASRSARLIVFPPRLQLQSLDTDPGWARTGGWAYGVPSGTGGGIGAPDPTAGHTGSAVFGINLGGNYPVTAAPAQTLTAGPFDLSGHEGAHLQFRRWLNTDAEPYVAARIEVSTNGVAWTQVWASGASSIRDSTWTLQTLPLGAATNGAPAVWLRWSHQVKNSQAYAMSGWNLDDIEILAQQQRHLTLDPIPDIAESAGSFTATVRLSPAPTAPLTLGIASTHPHEIAAPDPVTVPAGTTSFPITVIVQDNLTLDGPRLLQLIPFAASYDGIPRPVTLQDDETAQLTLTAPSSGLEGTTATAVLAIDRAPTVALAIALRSAGPAATVPASVTLPAGATEVSFPVTFPQDHQLTGPRAVELTATFPGWSPGAATISVADDDRATLSFAPRSAVAEGDGTIPGGLTLILGGLWPTPLTVALASSDETELTVPATVTVPAGQLSITVPLTVVDDTAPDGSQSVVVSAAAGSFSSGNVTISVGDNDPDHFTFDPIASPQFAGQPFAVRLQARDAQGQPVPGFRGTTSLSGRRGSTSAGLTPAFTTAFVGGVWNGSVTPSGAGTDWQILAGATGGPAGTSNFFTVVLPAQQKLPLENNDLTYDPGTDRLYATTPTGTIVPINPADGVFGPPITVTSGRLTTLVRASDGSRLWALDGDRRTLRRIDLPAGTPGMSFVVDAGLSYSLTAGDIAPLADRPGSLAIVLLEGSGFAGVAVFDEGVRRPVWSDRFTIASQIEPGLSSDRLYAYNNSNTGFEFSRLRIDADGVHLVDALGDLMTNFNNTLHADGSLVVGSQGRVLDGESRLALAQLPYTGSTLADAASARIYVLQESGYQQYILRAYETARFTEAGRLTVGSVPGSSATRLIRCGPGRLAFRTSSHVVLLRVPLVPDPAAADLHLTTFAGPTPASTGTALHHRFALRNLGGGTATQVQLAVALPPTASFGSATSSAGTVTRAGSQITLSLPALAALAEVTLDLRLTPTAAGSLTVTAQALAATGDPDTANNATTSTLSVASAPATPFLRTLALGARDLAYHPASGRLLASIGSTAALHANSIIALDPESGAITHAVYVGDQPGRLRLTADGAAAFYLLDGMLAAGRLDLTTWQAGSPFPIGHRSYYDSRFGEALRGLDLAPIAGRSDAVAISRANIGSSGEYGAALYLDGVPQPVTPNHLQTTATLLSSDSPGRLYGFGNNSAYEFFVLNVLADGIGVARSGSTGLISSIPIYGLKYAAGRVYASNGRVIDPEALVRLADLAVSGPVAPDPVFERVYFVTSPFGLYGGGPHTLRAFDSVSWQARSTLTLTGLTNVPSDLVRWGSDAFAIRTGAGEIVLLRAPTIVPHPPLRVLAPAQLREGAGTIPGLGQVVIDSPATAPIVVQLTPSQPAILDHDREVTIPLGATRATFALSVPDNIALHGPRSVTISATTTAPYTPRAATLLVEDDETAALSWSLPPSIGEGQLYTAPPLVLRLDRPSAGPLTVALSSSDTTELTVPATVTIPAGATTINVTATPVNDNLLDGPIPVTVTASVTGWAPATATLTITDDEPTTVRLSISGGTPREGGSNFITVTLGGVALAPITVAVTSDRPDELQSPGSLTLAAGTSSKSFSIWPVNDTARDGTQHVLLTPSAPGLTGVPLDLSIDDDDPAHLSFSSIATQTAGAPIGVTINLTTVDGKPAYAGLADVTLTASRGSQALPISPNKVYLHYAIGFQATLTSAGSDTRLTVTKGDLTATSLPFIVQPDVTADLAVSIPAGGTRQGIPFPVTVQARDRFGNATPSYSGFISLAGLDTSVARVSGGTPTTPSGAPFLATLSRSRTEMILRPEELGGAGLLRGVAFNVTSLQPYTLTRFTIRLQPTTRTSFPAYPDAGWTGSGWTTVHSADVTLRSTGWHVLKFDTPFAYDGASRLLLDLSFMNSGYTLGPSITVEATDTTSALTLMGQTGDYGGDPLLWAGTSGTYPTSTSQRPRVRLFAGTEPVVLPTSVGPFLGGTWSGPVQIDTSHAVMQLGARRDAVSGWSEPFAVAPLTLLAPQLAPLPAHVVGGPALPLAWSAIADALDYELERSPLPVGAPVTWLAVGTTGESQPAVSGAAAFRVRARRVLSQSVVTSLWSDTRVGQHDVSPPVVTWLGASHRAQVTTTRPVLTLAARAHDDFTRPGSLHVGGTPSPVSSDGSAQISLALTVGTHAIPYTWADLATPANVASGQLTVQREADSDGDRLPDAWEAAHGLDPQSTDPVAVWQSDPDGDGLRTLLEYAMGTAPTEPDPSPVHLLPPASPGGEWRLQFPLRSQVADFRVWIETSADLQHWEPLGEWWQLPVRALTGPDEAGVDRIEVALPDSTLSRRFARVRIDVAAP